MSEILGYDCDGKALRAGDRVVVVRVRAPHLDYLKAGVFEVIGPCPFYDGQVEFSAEDTRKGSPFRYISGLPSSLKKVGSDEIGDWDEIARSTKWHPTKQADPETTA